jgi:hypothetical protein
MRSLNKKYWLFILVALVLALVLAPELLLRYRQWRMDISIASWERIEVGMTEDEVIGILGVPPGTYSGTYWGGHPTQTTFFLIPGTTKKQWTGQEVIIEIGFDEEDKVAWSRLTSHINPDRLDEPITEKWKPKDLR